MRHLKTVLTVLGAVTVLVLASNTVVTAATGQGFILGKGNSANNITALKRTTSGSVLKLESATSANPPMTVTGTGKVANLNADKVDGYDSAALRDRATVWTRSITSPTSVIQLLFPLAAGSYLVGYSAFLNGAGGVDSNAGCYVAVISGITENYAAEDAGPTTISAPSAAFSASGVITVTSTDTVELRCYGDSFTTIINSPIQFYASPIGVTVSPAAEMRTGRVAAR